MRIATYCRSITWRWLLAAMTLVALVGCGVSSAGQLATQPTAAAITPPLNGVKVPYLTGISMVSADEGWVVGFDGYFRGGAFALHDQHGVWTMQPLSLQTSRTGMIFSPRGIQMLSASDGWIYGSLGQNYTVPLQAIMLHLVDGAWREEALPAGLSAIGAISFVSANTGWALAYPADLTSRDTLILRYSGGQWAIQKKLIGVRLTVLSMATRTDGMATGDRLYWYKTGVWALTTPRGDIPSVSFASVAMVSANEAWGLAFDTPPSNCQECATGSYPILAHFANGIWTQVKDAATLSLEFHHTFAADPVPNPLYATSGALVWITYGTFAHYAGDKRVATLTAECASDFWAISPVPGTDEAWVIGSSGQLFHYAVGKISRYETGAPCT